MNLNISLVQHIKKGFAIIGKKTDVRAENKKYKILGRQSIANQYNEPNHRKTQSKSITDTTNLKNTTRKSTNTISERTSIDNPFQSFYSSISVSALSKSNITSNQNRITLTTYLQRNTSVHKKLRRHNDHVDSL